MSHLPNPWASQKYFWRDIATVDLNIQCMSKISTISFMVYSPVNHIDGQIWEHFSCYFPSCLFAFLSPSISPSHRPSLPQDSHSLQNCEYYILERGEDKSSRKYPKIAWDVNLQNSSPYCLCSGELPLHILFSFYQTTSWRLTRGSLTLSRYFASLTYMSHLPSFNPACV